jgi:ribosomal protein S18 acetylase RimI-like enzyme
MADSPETWVRAFDGSLADAQGILAVERATFNESPYTAEQVRAMLAEGPQRAWLALGRERVVGFVVAFPARGLRGWWWEVDLLAVLPAWRGRRLATRLIEAASSWGVHLVFRARAVVATDNEASERAFLRAGFSAEPGTCKLLIHRMEDHSPQLLSVPGLQVREAASVAQARGWLAESSPDTLKGGEVFPAASCRGETPGLGRNPMDDQAPREITGPDQVSERDADLPSLAGGGDLTFLLAEQKGRAVGRAELIQVQTLLYRGVWIESLLAPPRAVRELLIQEAMSRARTAGLDEIGAMVPESDRPLQRSLRGQGFRSLGDYRWFGAVLRDSGLATNGCK